MKLRLRYTEKQEVIEVQDDLALIELCAEINERAPLSLDENLDQLSIKFGFPPKQLVITGNEVLSISDLGIRNGEVLIVDYPMGSTITESAPQAKSNTFTLINPDNLPYVKSETGLLTIHKVPDDNSCLFHSIIYSTQSESMVSVHDLRTVVANTIRENSEGNYNEAVLGKKLDLYSDWILNPELWGGEIELDILSKFLNVEIITIDIESQHSYHFNEQLPFFILLLYSGIHYDSIVYQQQGDLRDGSIDNTRVGKFYKDQPMLVMEILQNYPILVNMMNLMGFFTNTSKFKLKCGDCGKSLIGEKDASEHATETGHYNFQEYK